MMNVRCLASPTRRAELSTAAVYFRYNVKKRNIECKGPRCPLGIQSRKVWARG